MPRRYGLGLRTQILLALTAAFALAFSLLGVVAVRLVERDARVEQGRRAEAMAHSFAEGLGAAKSRSAGASLSRWVGRHGVAGVELARSGRALERAGEPGRGIVGRATLEDGAQLSVWLRPRDPRAVGPLSKLLRLYLFVTGAAILLLAYVLLTRLIVRPVEDLTRASERLARGAGSGHVPVRGAAEVVRLAVALNRMGVELAAEREALEARLRELETATRELRATQDQLIRSEKLASVGRLAAGVAHEIGNPLAAILGLIELLRGGGLEPRETAEFLDRVRAETERIHRIIRDLLDYSRSAPDAGETDVACDVEAVVEDAVKLVAPQKDLRGVTLERRFAADLPPVRAPADSLTQVVLNLLLNAADAVEGEGNILIEVEGDGDEVCLSVLDSGPGVAPEVLSTLFDPFVTTKPTGQGTGLGLSVSQALVERAGGRIAADNAPRGGARFRVWLRTATSGSQPI